MSGASIEGPLSARLGRQVLRWSENEAEHENEQAAEAVTIEPLALSGRPYLVFQVGAMFNAAHPSVPVLVDKGRHQIIDCTPEEAERLADPDGQCWRIRELASETVVTPAQRPNARARAALPNRAAISNLVAAASQSSYRGFVEDLAEHPTRHSLSGEFQAAAGWARQLFEGWGYAVELMSVPVGSGTSHNVIARRRGRATGDRQAVLVTAHLDSINIAGGPSAPAPGADDNASGVAGVLEIARLLAAAPIDDDLTLVLFGGEEQGLHGSTRFVAGLSAAERATIKGVINLDMVASRNSAVPTVLLEGAALSSQLMEVLATAAATHTTLSVETSLNPFASDHVPFIDAGIPAVLTIEGTDSANGNVHTAADLVDHLDFGFAIEIVRMNLAAAAELLGVGNQPSTRVPTVAGPVVAWGPNRLDVFVIG